MVVETTFFSIRISKALNKFREWKPFWCGGRIGPKYDRMYKKLTGMWKNFDSVYRKFEETGQNRNESANEYG